MKKPKSVEQYSFNISQAVREVLNPDLIEFYYNECDKRLIDCIRVESIITERAYLLCGMYFAIETAVLGYIMTHLYENGNAPVINACLALVVFTGIALGYIIVVIRPHGYYPHGRVPEKLRIEENAGYLKEHREKIDQKSYIMCDELTNLGSKIFHQSRLNRQRTRLTKISIYFMIAGLILSVVSFLISINV